MLGLFHIGRRAAEQDGHRKALAYLVERHGLDPGNAHVVVSPSISASSYKFPSISEEQKTNPAWEKYVCQDESGMWHVDFRTRIIEELKGEGVRSDHVYVSPEDTGSGDRYFSHRQFKENQQACGRNAVMFCLHSG
ncbi:MAG: laccase domain-containing protein [Candidatus Saccharimonadales bacterium]